MNKEQQKDQLRDTIIESMEGIIIDNEARSEKDIVEFYADVFVTICEDYTNTKLQQKEAELTEAKKEVDRLRESIKTSIRIMNGEITMGKPAITILKNSLTQDKTE